MYYLLFPIVFIVNYVRQLFKWVTKGFYRTFKHAYENTKKQVASVLEEEKEEEPEFRSPRFLMTGEPEAKKRKRRGHRGGRKHRRNKKKGNRHD